MLEESNEIAEMFNIPCKGSRSRYEIEGEAQDDELFNDFIILTDMLVAKGLVLFDSANGKQLD